MVPTPIYHITPVDNLASIIQEGELRCPNLLHQLATGYTNIAHQHIQDRRAAIRVPCGPGGTLHDYVPFYFAPRSPMLYTINGGYVQGVTGGQEPIIHLVTTIAAVQAAQQRFVFSDGHAVIGYTNFYTDIDRLDQIDWPLMKEKYWNDTPDYPDRKRRRQAEFLIYEACPWTLISKIGVYSLTVKAQVEAALVGASHRPLVRVVREWYY